MSAVESPLADPSKARHTVSPGAGSPRSESANLSQAPHGTHDSACPTPCTKHQRRNDPSGVVNKVGCSASAWRKPPNTGLPIFHAATSSKAQPTEAACSISLNSLSSVFFRPYATSRHITDSTLSAGVDIASVSDSGRLPAANDTDSHTLSVTTCSSSTIISVGS